MDIEKKEKAKKIGLRIWLGISTALSLMFVVFVAIACSNVNSNKQANAELEVIEFHQDNKLNVVYDDEHYIITLSGEELDYSFNHTCEFLFSDGLTNFGTISMVLIDDSSTMSCSYGHSDSSSIAFLGTDDNYYGFYLVDSDWYLYAISDDELISEYCNSITFNFTNFSSSDYNNFKTEFLLDIQANEPQPFVPSIFSALTNSITGFISTLGVGIVAITSIFWSNNALTTIGLLSVIVVAVFIAYWLFRLIIGLIRMRG